LQKGGKPFLPPFCREFFMEKDSVFNYATPIHKSLIQDDVDLGIGIAPVVLIVIITIVLMRLVSIWCMFAGFALFIIAKISIRKDPHLLEALFERLFTPEVYRS